MAPGVTNTETAAAAAPSVRPKALNANEAPLELPPTSKARMEKAGIDLSNGYPFFPNNPPTYYQDAFAVRNDPWHHDDPGARAAKRDPTKSALLSACTKVTDLTANIGTELEGVQLKDLTDVQRDELALLIAERCVVFLRDQDLSPQKQLELGQYFGVVEVNPQQPHVPGVPGVNTIWPSLMSRYRTSSFRNPGGAAKWHTDLVHERQPAGITHLHNDTIPSIGGDTLWASGYAAYSKLSPEFRKIIDGKSAVVSSPPAIRYLDRDDPSAPARNIERVHPIVRVHPATGWRSLFVNRSFTKRIIGFDQKESDAILAHLFDVYDQNIDIQCRFKWTPRTSALWDNRITIHAASWDYEEREERHGTRCASLAEEPYYDANAPTRRQALGLEDA